MRSLFARFLADDRGAITVDWIALTAGVLLLGLAVVYFITVSQQPLVVKIAERLAKTNVPTYAVE